MIAALLAQIGLPLLVNAVGGALRGADHPVAKAAGEALGAVDAAISDGEISGDDLKEANRHLEKMTELEAAADQTWLQEVNKTIRTEVASSDAYVRRMRPTFGYIMALTWAGQMGAIAYVIVTDAPNAGPVIAAVASLGTIWTVGLSVLGIYVYKRSQEKTAGLSSDTGLGPDLGAKASALWKQLTGKR